MPSTRTLATSLLPTEHGLRLDDVSIGPDQIVATLEATASRSTCPICGTWSEAVHSLYQRTMADLPWGRQTVRLHLRVRKFFCRQPTCSRRVFTERLPSVVAPYARRTRRLREVVRLLAFALGGEPGARIVERLGMATSPATMLRLIRRSTAVAAPTPRVLGVDDWAFRKGHRYGTILVDLERRQVVDLLGDRRAATLVPWLQEHSGIEVISRDRAPAYAEAAGRGAPDAVQVVDRWHLGKNLIDAVEKCLLRYRQQLKDAAEAGAPGSSVLPSDADAEQVPWQQRAEEASQQKHAEKLELYERIHALHAIGATKREIARALAVTRPTVYRYLALEQPPERRHPRRSRRRVLASYEPYLLKRWQEGCHNRSQLFREIQAQGYQHGLANVIRFLKRVARDPGGSSGTMATRLPQKAPGPRQVAGFLVQRPEKLTDEDRAYLGRLCDHEPTIATIYTLTTEFMALMRERRGQHLEAWLAQVSASGIVELVGFARGLLDDRAPVEAALRLPWSNGQTEGQVNKLKLLKRSMYGRAKLDLLRLRLLNAA